MSVSCEFIWFWTQAEMICGTPTTKSFENFVFDFIKWKNRHSGNFVGIYPNGFELGQKFQCSSHMEKLYAERLINFWKCLGTGRVTKVTQIVATNLILQFQVSTFNNSELSLNENFELSSFSLHSVQCSWTCTFDISYSISSNFERRNFLFSLDVWICALSRFS